MRQVKRVLPFRSEDWQHRHDAGENHHEAAEQQQPEEKVRRAALLGAVREQCTASSDGQGQCGVTQMKSVIIVRYLGDNSEVARRVMLAAWQVLRPALLDRDAVIPRIWNT